MLNSKCHRLISMARLGANIPIVPSHRKSAPDMQGAPYQMHLLYFRSSSGYAVRPVCASGTCWAVQFTISITWIVWRSVCSLKQLAALCTTGKVCQVAVHERQLPTGVRPTCHATMLLLPSPLVRLILLVPPNAGHPTCFSDPRITD